MVRDNEKRIHYICKTLAKKSAELSDYASRWLADRHKQIIECMDIGIQYSTEEIAEKIGLKGARTRQLLNELVSMGLATCTVVTKNRRYVRE